MLLFDEYNRTIIIDDLLTPITIDYFWVLDLELKDFTLSEIKMLEAITGPAVCLEINGFRFWVPTSWFILIVDEETNEIDLIQIPEGSGKSFTALGGSFELVRPYYLPMKIVDYHPCKKLVSPSLTREQMLCHPVDPQTWVSITPLDQYNKYVKDLSIDDLF